MKSITITAAVVALLASAPAFAEPAGTRPPEAQQAAVTTDKPVKKSKRAKASVKCTYEKVTGSNRRQRVCRSVSQTQADETQAREELRELRRVMPDL